MPTLEQSVVVVTGATSGVGRATALALAHEGAALVLVARRAEALEEVAAQCRGLGVEVVACPCDVSDEDAVADVVRASIEHYGRVDVWVNNAAVSVYGRLEETPGHLWRRVVETNLFGYFHGARAVLPWFREQGGGVIINVASILAKTGAPYQSAYVASKHAIRAMGECVAQETVDVPGIKVCTVLPGPIDTPLFQVAANLTGRRVVPPGRPVDPRRVADAVVACARRPRRQAIVGMGPRLGLVANRLAPGITERVTARLMEREHFGDEPAERSEGNVHEPVAAGARIDGGWRDESAGRRWRAVLAIAAALIAGRALRRALA